MTTVAQLDISVWDCPLDLVKGERVILFESFLNSEFGATVEDVVGGILSVRVDGFYAIVSSVNPLVTAWKREQPVLWSGFWGMTEPSPKEIKYGATCSNSNCYTKFYPDAENVPGFKCYSCRNNV